MHLEVVSLSEIFIVFITVCSIQVPRHLIRRRVGQFLILVSKFRHVA